MTTSSIRECKSYLGRKSNCKTYDVSFFNEHIFTTVTSNPVEVSKWIYNTKSHPHSRLIVGLDTEWRPHYKQNTVAVLQLCVDNRCLVYQIFHSPHVPQSLVDFLSDNNIIFVGVAVKNDLNKLQNDYEIGSHAQYEDLRSLAARVCNRDELKNAGLKRLAADVLWKEMDKQKEVTMSRWDKWSLTEEQVKYACLDAFVSFEIGRVLMSMLSYY